MASNPSQPTVSAATWARAIENALELPGFVRPAFQPILDLRRGVVSGYEMLARFNGGPDASPDRWFAAAARLGKEALLEARTVHLGLAARQALPRNCFLTINLNPELLEAPQVQAALNEHQRLHGVVLELTEHSQVDDEVLDRTLPLLRARGAMIAIDDVGSGYSGLQRISTQRPEFVKIDRSIITGLHQDPAKREMVESLGAVANRIDAWIVAEGIEQREELAALIQMKVPLAQGFALARPSPAMEGPRVELSGWIATESAAHERSGLKGSSGRTPRPSWPMPAANRSHTGSATTRLSPTSRL